MTVPEILDAALKRASLERSALRERLSDAGLPMSRQRLHSWFAGVNVPDPEALPHLCEILSLDGKQAAALYQASKIPLPSVLQPLAQPEAA